MNENDREEAFGCLIFFIFSVFVFSIALGGGCYLHHYGEIDLIHYQKIQEYLPDCQPEVDEAMQDGKISSSEFNHIHKSFAIKQFNKSKAALLSKKAEKEH